MNLNSAALMFLGLAYRNFLRNSKVLIPEAYHDEKVFIYDIILLKKYTPIEWFEKLRADGVKSLIIVDDDSIEQNSSLVPVPFFPNSLLAISAERSELFSLGENPLGKINRGLVKNEIWIELKNQFWDSCIYTSPSLIESERKLVDQLNMNLASCEKETENQFAKEGVEMYQRALDIIEYKTIKLPDYVLFPEILSEKEKYLLSAISTIDIGFSMGSFRDLYFEGMTEELYDIILIIYQSIINRNYP